MIRIKPAEAGAGGADHGLGPPEGWSKTPQDLCNFIQRETRLVSTYAGRTT